MICHYNTKLKSGGSGKYFSLLKDVRNDQIFDAIGNLSFTNILLFILRNYKLVRNEKLVKVFHSQIVLLVLIFFCHGRVIFVPHGIINGMKYQKHIRNVLHKIIFRFFSVEVIGCGEDEYTNILKLIGKNGKAKASLLLNPAIPVQSKATIDGDRLLFCGPCISQKGLDRLLDLVPQEYEDKLDIVTSLDVNTKYANLCKRKLKDKNVQIFGFRKIDGPFLMRYKALIVCSRFEGLPFLALEALSSGIHVILPAVPGCAELSKYNGVMVYDFDQVDLSKELSAIYKSAKLTDSDISLIEGKYSIEKFIHYWRDVK